MYPYRFDLAHWSRLFPLEDWRGVEIPRAGEIVSPRDICLIEQVRAEWATQFDFGPAVPVDVFAFAKGEPDQRHCTKIGGLPYRPADLPWPRSDAGQPLTFLAQFNFAGSADILPPLPGQVLLLFVPDEVLTADDPDALHYEWYDVPIGNLIPPEAVPAPVFKFVTCYGYIHRTHDYPEAEKRLAPLDETLAQVMLPFVIMPEMFFCLKATKIGGTPFYIQTDSELPGRPLCVLNWIRPLLGGVMYPWINVPDPYPRDNSWLERAWSEDNTFHVGDGGSIYFSIDDDRELHWDEQCF